MALENSLADDPLHNHSLIHSHSHFQAADLCLSIALDSQPTPQLMCSPPTIVGNSYKPFVNYLNRLVNVELLPIHCMIDLLRLQLLTPSMTTRKMVKLQNSHHNFELHLQWPEIDNMNKQKKGKNKQNICDFGPTTHIKHLKRELLGAA